jgi:hypothetical protein
LRSAENNGKVDAILLRLTVLGGIAAIGIYAYHLSEELPSIDQALCIKKELCLYISFFSCDAKPGKKHFTISKAAPIAVTFKRHNPRLTLEMKRATSDNKCDLGRYRP